MPLLPYKKNAKAHLSDGRRRHGCISHALGPTRWARYCYPSRDAKGSLPTAASYSASMAFQSALAIAELSEMRDRVHLRLAYIGDARSQSASPIIRLI
jgi:hypothetical protein